jgi:RNA polymerase-binding transcription factor DksA
VADILDEVAENVDTFNETALKQQLESTKPKKPYEDDEEEMECAECGAPIGRQRRKTTGDDLCVECRKWEDRVKSIRRNRGE